MKYLFFSIFCLCTNSSAMEISHRLPSDHALSWPVDDWTRSENIEFLCADQGMRSADEIIFRDGFIAFNISHEVNFTYSMKCEGRNRISDPEEQPEQRFDYDERFITEDSRQEIKNQLASYLLSCSMTMPEGDIHLASNAAASRVLQRLKDAVLCCGSGSNFRTNFLSSCDDKTVPPRGKVRSLERSE